MGCEMKFLITSVQSHALPHYKFLKSLETYCQKNVAELIVLPMIGRGAFEDMDKIHAVYQPYLEFNKRKINNNLQIEQFHIRPAQIDPLTGLNRFAQRATSLIFASPKQRMKPIHHSNHKYPKFLITTGAASKPRYATGQDVSADRRRLGNIAKRDHVYGALLVDVQDDEIFHLRNIRADAQGSFIDLGKKYNGGRVTNSILEALVLGDYHLGDTDPQTREVNYQMIEQYKPKKLILHDFFNGHSVNPHIEKSFIQQKLIHQYDTGYNSLERELEEGHDELIELSKAMKGREIYIIPSNHNEFLNRYLDEGLYIKDIGNFRIATKLALYMAEKDFNNPVEGGYNCIGKLPKNIKFLRRTDDLKVKGYQLGSHGDRGPGGSKGSMNTKEADFGKSITGHVHRAQILRETYTVGTSTHLSLPYTRGYPSDWSHTNAFLWENGKVQLVSIIEGCYES